MTLMQTPEQFAQSENAREKRLHQDLLLHWSECNHTDPYADGLRGHCPRCCSVRHVIECEAKEAPWPI